MDNEITLTKDELQGIKDKMNHKKEVAMATRGSAGRGSRGACGGTRRRDGSGQGVGNIGKKNQPPKKRK